MPSEPPHAPPPRPPIFGFSQPLGGMNTPGQTPEQRVVHTSDAFFKRFIDIWLLLSLVLTGYTAIWEPSSLYAAVISLASGVLIRSQLHQQKTGWLRWLFIAPSFLMIMVAPWFINGIRTPLLTHCTLLLIFTGWMLGTRMMWAFTGCLTALFFSLWTAERQGWWHMPQPLREIDMWLIALLFSLVVTAIVMSALIKNYRADLERETAWQYHLQHALQFNALVINSSPMPMRVFGPQGECLAVNDAYARLMGTPRELLMAQNLNDGAMPHADMTSICLQVLRSGQACQQEIQITTADARTLWLGMHLLPFMRDQRAYLLMHLQDMTDQRHATQELQQMAFYDSLTGLANRRLFCEHFQQSSHLRSRSGEWAAVLLLDMNNFKALNDQHGHAAGDAMLLEVASRMQACMRSSDVIARLGGDEFTLLLQGIGSDATQALRHTQQTCDKLQQVLSEPYCFGSITHHASVSIGMTLLHPQSDATLDALLQEADMHMYTQKRAHAQKQAAAPVYANGEVL